MQPLDYASVRPFDSVMKNAECEIVARNILTIIGRGNNEWGGVISWEEYKTERLKDGNFTESEKEYFDKVFGFMTSEESVKAFAPNWRELSEKE